MDCSDDPFRGAARFLGAGGELVVTLATLLVLGLVPTGSMFGYMYACDVARDVSSLRSCDVNDVHILGN